MKEFVEHLRTVHFALLGVCFLLLTLAFSKVQDEVAAAQRQLGELRKGEQAWSTSKINALANEQVAAGLKGSLQMGPSLRVFGGVDEVGLKRASPAIFSEQFVEITSPQLPTITGLINPPLRLAFEEPNWIVDNNRYSSFFTGGGIFKTLRSGPATIRDFGRIWDSVTERLSVYIPLRLSDYLYTVYVSTPGDPRSRETREWKWRLTDDVSLVPLPKLEGSLVPEVMVSGAVRP